MDAHHANKLVRQNVGLWAIAAILYPLAHWLPTASGAPPRIFDVLIPLLVILMGYGSTTVLRTAIGSRSKTDQAAGKQGPGRTEAAGGADR